MGKFINTSYTQAVEKVSETVKTFINNPYYMWTDKKPTLVTYYPINMERSTLDEAARIPYADVGEHSPIRYDRIKNFVIYGLDRIQLSLENGEFGLESGPIEGDAIILPGSVEPSPGDYFEINLATDSTWLFRVNSVDRDTLDNGSNIWKISYKLEHDTNDNLLPLVIQDYSFIPTNVGTRYNSVVRSDKYDLVYAVDKICSTLKSYFIGLFYKPQVQTFIFVNYGEDYFYDPYMIEFLIRNHIIDGASDDAAEYIYVDHKIAPIKTFALDYNRTFFKSIEDRDSSHLMTAKIDSTADYIDDFGSIFASRAENYFKMNYSVPTYDTFSSDPVFHNVMECFPKMIIPNIRKNDLYTDAEVKMNPFYAIYNIIIKYFNNALITEAEYFNLEKLDFDDSMKTFYMIPVLIYCLEDFEKKMLAKEPTPTFRVGEVPEEATGRSWG